MKKENLFDIEMDAQQARNKNFWDFFTKWR